MNHAPLVKHKDYRRHVGISYNICLLHFVEKMKKWEEAFWITLIHHERIADFLSPLNHSLSNNACNAMYMLRNMVYVTLKSQEVLRCPWCLTLSLNELMMETFFALLALCESQRPVTRNFDVFFELRLNKQWSKQSRRRWFEAPSRSSWHHSNTSAVLILCGLDLGELEWNLNQITKNFAREK